MGVHHSIDCLCQPLFYSASDKCTAYMNLSWDTGYATTAITAGWGHSGLHLTTNLWRVIMYIGWVYTADPKLLHCRNSLFQLEQLLIGLENWIDHMPTLPRYNTCMSYCLLLCLHVYILSGVWEFMSQNQFMSFI